MAELARSRALVAGYRHRSDASTRRLIVTVFGDSIVPRGGSVWLGTLIDLLAGLDINERLVRTSVQRLVAEGVLANERVGRRSRYSLTEAARIDARDAERRIYHGIETAWDGRWTMVIAIDSTELPTDFEQRLGWRGFGRLRPGVFASPIVPPDAARRLLVGLGVDERFAVVSAAADTDDRALAEACFDLGAVQEGYTSFVTAYATIASELCDTDPSDELGFALRTLLIDDFRRVLLRDPELPAPLLPDDWAGAAARRVAADVYGRVDAAADRHLARLWASGSDEQPTSPGDARSRFETTADRTGPLSG